jgi:hypothetical protein
VILFDRTIVVSFDSVVIVAVVVAVVYQYYRNVK